MTDLLNTYTSHLADDRHPDRTACGESWQGWQQPDAAHALSPHDQPQIPYCVRQCQACFARAIGRR